MTIRIGIDLVDAQDVRESISAHGARYLQRVYSEQELSDCRSASEVDPERLAARFAAKEATLKVLRIGDEAVSWREIEVRRSPAGWVDLLLTGRAARLAADAGIINLALSLSHERGLASAVVIAELPKAADV